MVRKAEVHSCKFHRSDRGAELGPQPPRKQQNVTRIHLRVRQVQRVRLVRLLQRKRLADVDGLEVGRLDGLEKDSSTFRCDGVGSDSYRLDRGVSVADVFSKFTQATR